MIKRLLILGMALNLALSPAASAFAATACHSLPSQEETSHCKHHHEAALLQDQGTDDTHQNCHSEQDKDSNAKCSCHCAAPVAGLINTLSDHITENVNDLIISPIQTQHSVTEASLFKPPRA